MTREEAYQLIKLYRKMIEDTSISQLVTRDGILTLDLGIIKREFEKEDDWGAAKVIEAHTL